MAKISKFGENFLFLAFRIDKHIKGYVDFYFGPERIKNIVENESLTSPNRLLDDSNKLINQLEVQGYDKTREHYLTKLLTAMKTLRLIQFLMNLVSLLKKNYGFNCKKQC